MSLQTGRIVWLTQDFTKFIRLGPLGEDGHVHVPGRTAPLRPDTVVFVLTTSVGVHQKAEFAAVLHKPRHDRAQIMHRNKRTFTQMTQ